MGDEPRDLVIGGRYLDSLQKRSGEWRITRRTMLYDWQQDFGRSVDWANGLLGMPFLTQHAVGSARGDHSVELFKRHRPKE